MKKIMTLIVVALFTTATFAQDSKGEVKPEVKSDKPKHECYMMKDGTLMHCTGDKTEALVKEVALVNGTVLTPRGEVKPKDGKPVMLENGQCVSMVGGIGDCEMMHARLKSVK
jgi:hypothetical protein